MPAQVVTPLETMESWEEETQLLARNRLVISLRLCRTQAGLGISTELTSFCQPVYHRSNVLDGMRVGSRDIPKDRRPPRCGLSGGTNLPKFQFVPLNVTNSGYLTPTTVWHVTWETRALLDSTRPHFWRPATPAASANEVASMLGIPSLSPRRPIHKMAKAARWISLEKHGGESPMSSCQNCATAGSMAVELCSRSCRIFHGKESLGQSRYQIMRFERRVTHKVQGRLLPSRVVRQGVDMGRSFSVFLFCFAMDPLFHYLNRIPHVLSVQAYVDDTTLVGCTEHAVHTGGRPML